MAGKKWEYKIQSFGNAFKQIKDEKLVETLNEWGVDGWEVIHCYQNTGNTRISVIAKRPFVETRSTRRSNFPEEDWA